MSGRLEPPQGTSVFAIVCVFLGHAEGQPVMWDNDVYVICPRCGKHL
jgi:hypothetical protein